MTRILAGWRQQPLRVRLVALFTALLLAALLSVGWLALTLLRSSLLAQVDAQLTAAAQAIVEESYSAIRNTPTESNELIPSEYAVVIALPDGGTAYEVSTAHGMPDVGSLSLTEVIRRESQPRTVPSRSGPTLWRVLDSPLRGSDGTIIGAAAVALPLDALESTMGRMATGLALVSIGVLALVGIATDAVVRRSLAPLRRIEATASRIAAGDLTQRVPAAPPSTEVGSLAASLNTMLGDLEESFEVRRASEERMQRFVGDASHELRTPLATVAGYTELYRMGGIPPEELPGVMERIEDSATRMGALVADLLSLARLDQGAPLHLEDVDVPAILDAAASDLRALDTTRSVTLVLGPAARAVESGGGAAGGGAAGGARDGEAAAASARAHRLTARADPSRLAQVLTNLVGNASAYTPPGSPVELVARAEGPWCVIDVVDHGPGVPEADRERIFERFARLDAGRARDAGGSGLGLSIARASTTAMGGDITCLATPGGGTTMRLRLPLAPS